MRGSGALKSVAVAAGVGAAAVFVGAFAGSKIAYLSEQPWLLPAALIGVGFLLARRKRLAAGLGLVGAGGALGFMQYAQSHPGTFSAGPAPKQAAGWPGDAGRFVRPDHGMFEQSAGALLGAGGRGIYRQQDAMGPGDAGALIGGGAGLRQIETSDAMGLDAG